MARHSIAALAALALGACAGTALGGCGSQTKTVTAAATPPVTNTTGTSTHAATTSPPTTSTASTAPAQTTTAGGAAAPSSTTRTAPEPALAHNEAHKQAEGLGEALATLKSAGYTANETSQYHSNQTLRVLVGTKTGSSDGYDQQAFFFVNGRYIGTDTKEPSATVNVLSQSDTEITLGYPLYRRGDPLSSPSGGQATVHFQLNDGTLTALDPIPPANSASGLSRY